MSLCIELRHTVLNTFSNRYPNFQDRYVGAICSLICAFIESFAPRRQHSHLKGLSNISHLEFTSRVEIICKMGFRPSNQPQKKDYKKNCCFQVIKMYERDLGEKVQILFFLQITGVCPGFPKMTCCIESVTT